MTKIASISRGRRGGLRGPGDSPKSPKDASSGDESTSDDQLPPLPEESEAKKLVNAVVKEFKDKIPEGLFMSIMVLDTTDATTPAYSIGGNIPVEALDLIVKNILRTRGTH